jgi:hypothetical protein
MSDDKKTSDTPKNQEEAKTTKPESPASSPPASGVNTDTAAPKSASEVLGSDKKPEAEKSETASSGPEQSAKPAVKKGAIKKEPTKKPAAKPAVAKASSKPGTDKTKTTTASGDAGKSAKADTGSSSTQPHYTPTYSASGSAAPSSTSSNDGKSGTGFPTLLAAAALGGLIVYFLVSGFGSSGPDKNTTARLDVLQTRIDQVELSTNDPNVANTIRTEIEQLKTRITELQGLQRQVDRLSGSGGSKGGLFGGSSDISALEGGVTEVNDAIRQIQSRLSQFSGEVTRNEARLTSRLDELETRTPMDLSTTLDALTNRMSSIERNDVAREAFRAASAVALANLTRASQGSSPFSAEFKAVQIIMEGDESLTELQAFSESGLPSVSILSKRFKDAARKIAKARRSESSWGFLGRLWSNLIASVTVRPKGDVKGTSVNAILARSEVRLEEGNLGAAIDELDALEGKASEAAQAWLDEARARARLDNLIGVLNTRVIADISAETRRAFSPSSTGLVTAPTAGRTGPGSQPLRPRNSLVPAPSPTEEPIEEPRAPETGTPTPPEGNPAPEGEEENGETEAPVSPEAEPDSI